MKTAAVEHVFSEGGGGDGGGSGNIESGKGGGGEVKCERHLLLREMRPLLLTLRALGALPLRLHDAEGASCRACSGAVAYALLLFASLGAPVVVHAVAVLRRLMNGNNTFSQLTMDLLTVAYAQMFCMIPLLNWREAGRVANFFEEWALFQEEFLRATGRALQLHLRRRAWMTLAVAAAGAAAATAARVQADAPWTALPMAHLHLVMGVMAAVWGAQCRALEQAAGAIYTCAKEARPFGLHRFVAMPDSEEMLQMQWSREKGSLFYIPSKTVVPVAATPPASSRGASAAACGAGDGGLAGLRHLWLRLSRLARLQGDAQSDTLSHFCLFLFVTLTVGAFGTLSDLSSNGLSRQQPRMATVFLHSALMLFFVCDAAHRATHQVGFQLQEKILLEDFSSRSPQAKKEIDQWLRAMAMTPPVISLRGYARVDRGMFLSIMTTMVTYLVVLVQFNQTWSMSQ